MIAPDQAKYYQTLIQERSEPEPYSGCWIWTRGYFGHKYANHRRPALCISGKNTFAAHLAYEAFNGPIEAGLNVLHCCDVAACVNPRHLELGTQTKNNRDAVLRGHARPGGHPVKNRRF